MTETTPGPEAQFRAYLAQGRFMIQRSKSTGAHVFYPRVAAPGTGEADLEWVEASGEGTVYATTVVRNRPEKGGDYNVAPGDEDVHDPKRFKDDALCRPETRRAFRALLHLGLTEAFRALHGEPHRYSYWDYGRAFEDDEGLRIDHFLLSSQAADRLVACEIDRAPRKETKPSDHTPVCLELRD